MGFGQYRRTQITEPWKASASADKEAGSPRSGDMIARNPKNHADRWLIAAQYFSDNSKPI
jgi:hypothetical protein